MSLRERMKRYKTTGAAAGLTRVEVLVPPEGRGQVLSLARRLRDKHRNRKAAGQVNAEQVNAEQINAEQINDRAKLIMHRLVARRMASDPDIVERGRSVLAGARASGRPYTHLDEWETLISLPAGQLRRILTSRTDRMVRLRLSSPFAENSGFEDPALRRRIWRKARLGMPKP